MRTTRAPIWALLLPIVLVAGCPARQATAPSSAAPAVDPVAGLMAQGKQAFRAGQWEQAEAAFAQVRQRRPELLEAGSYLGQCALQKREYEKASGLLSDVTKRQPQSAAGLLGLGQAYEGLQRAAEALTCYQTALGLDPHSEAARQGTLRLGTPKRIAITIDDGPSLEYTLKAMEEAEKYGGRVTFFVTGRWAVKEPQIIRLMAQRGHQIGDHTWDHVNLAKLPADKIRDQLGRTRELIVKQGGPAATVYRPPYGAHNAAVDKIAGEMGMRVAMWDVDTTDWKPGRQGAETVAYVLSHARPNAVVLMHQVHPTYTVLDQVFKGLHDQGYTCVRLDELGKYPATTAT